MEHDYVRRLKYQPYKQISSERRVLDLELEVLGLILTGGNILSPGFVCVHMVNPPMPINALLAISSSLWKPRVGCIPPACWLYLLQQPRNISTGEGSSNKQVWKVWGTCTVRSNASWVMITRDTPVPLPRWTEWLTDRHYWKNYLSTISLAGSNSPLLICCNYDLYFYRQTFDQPMGLLDLYRTLKWSRIEGRLRFKCSVSGYPRPQYKQMVLRLYGMFLWPSYNKNSSIRHNNKIQMILNWKLFFNSTCFHIFPYLFLLKSNRYFMFSETWFK